MNALRWTASALARSWRVRVEGDGRVGALRAAGKPIVFAVWHGRMLPPLWHRRHEGIGVLVSSHRDGGYLAGAAHAWGYAVFRGSSTRGGVAGLRSVVRWLRAGRDAGFAADGPRGPAGVAKPGLLAAARLSGAAVVPVGVDASGGWQIRSWDRMQIPKPRACVHIVYGEPLGADDVMAAAGATRLTAALERAQRLAKC